ncbi:MAG: DNRLRE domain-containing protein [Chloroflexi bacterium]|nr:DNRLRE domain-containing protein [Chloroflexota bacterium]
MVMKRAAIVLPLILTLLLLVVQPIAIADAAALQRKTQAPTPTPTPTSTTTLSACATSTPSSGTYSVTLCFTSPANGAVVSGAPQVTVSVSTTGTSPGVQRIIFYLNGAYLLTDFQSAYTFNLPTTKWQDGTYTLSATALMRDGYTTTQQPAISLTFSNGITSPPVNQNTFTPTSGTTPANGAPFIVVAGGDGADGDTSASGVTKLIASLNPNLFLYLGDVYEKGSVSEFYNWYGNQGSNFSAFNSITDPTIGNHEYTGSSAPGYFDYWDNIPNYYSFNAGGWHFISLNSNSSRIGVDPSSAQYQWLAQDLAANAQACTIVYYHHPVFNIGPEGPTTAMSAIWSLMAQYGVSIVLNGHDHDYQRWVPLDGNGNPSPTGITEFVAGTTGHGLQTFITTDSRVAFSDDVNPDAFGVLRLALNSSGASFSFIDTKGVTLDSGVVPCVNAATDTQPPSTPSGLTATATGATQVDLAWQASTDNVGVAGYTIYRDGASLATVIGSTLSYSDFTVLPSTTYSYTVDAFDQSGNHSAQSSPASVTTPAMPSSLTFTVQADAYVNSSYPNNNYGSATVWRVDSSPVLNGYLRFTVQGLAGYAIGRATLMVYTNTSSSIGIQALAVADNTWGETTITYNNAPPMGAAIGSSLSYSAGSWVPVDVTPYVTGEGTYSFGITTVNTSTQSFAARESGSNPAQFVLELAVPDDQAPSTPTGLTATASRATQVDLAWQASTDNVGVAGYTIYRDGAALATVSGTTLAYSDATVQPSTSYTYTVDAFDQAGNHSAQSAPVSVTTPSMPSSLTFNVDADSYVSASYPITNYGSATVWRVDGSPDLHAYLRFSVQGTAGYTIQHAYLKVYANSSGSAGINALAVADNTWDESTITYNTAPPLGAVLDGVAGRTPGSWVTIDVTSYVTGDGTYSFGVNTPGSTQISFASKESGANAAQLVVELAP